MATADDVNILVVDDLPDKLLVMRSVLEDLGETIVEARSGEDALRRVLEQDFAVILLDVNMPGGMDGFETAALIRGRKKSAHVPIIFITAYADEMHTTQGYSLGAVDYIFSPVVPVVLRTKVKVFVDLFRMTQQARRQADERVALAQEQAARAAAEEARRRSAFLAEASNVLASSLDPEATLRALARIVVPFLADLGAVTRVAEEGGPGRTELAWRSSAGEASERAVALDELPAELAGAIRETFASGKQQALTGLSAPPAGGRLGKARGDLALRSAVVLPLLARGRTLGALSLGLGPSERPHAHADLALAEDLAGRAAIALDNAQLYQNIQEGDRRKDDFLAMLAHELRNPLAPIRTAVHVMRLLGLQEEQLSQARDMIDRQVTHMTRLIDDLLDVSRLSRGKVLLRKECLDLTEVVRATAEDHRAMLEAGGLRLRVSLPGRSLWTTGDPTRLAQVIGNVLHNASKFTDPGGLVTVDLADAGGGLASVRVRDTGIGIEPAMLRRAFDTFSQADRSLARSRGGLGLGLALVKGLVELHGGQAHVGSPGPGLGTEVTIRLPLTEGPALPDPTPPAKHSVSALRVLIIEDNADAAESMRLLLTLQGHTVEVAASGSAGVEAGRAFRPNVVLCDIGLPGDLDGYGVARACRRDPVLAPAYLIAATGYGRAEDQVLALDAGFDAHLTKPVDFADLLRLFAGVHARA